MNNGNITGVVGEVNLVTPCKAMIRQHSSVTTVSFKTAMVVYNAARTEKCRELRAQDGRALWR